MSTESRLLGAVEARIDGLPLKLGHARQHLVLAALLAEAGSLLLVDQLVHRV
ncbi:hypothetical protein [Plantactinospora endophytica]|nr:hypothetical protein [Plantactinospora endophytica]